MNFEVSLINLKEDLKDEHLKVLRIKVIFVFKAFNPASNLQNIYKEIYFSNFVISEEEFLKEQCQI